MKFKLPFLILSALITCGVFTLFLYNRNYTKKYITIISTGDINLANEINEKSLDSHNNFYWPFQNISSLFHTADVVITNLESPLVSGCVRNKEMFYILCGSDKFIPQLKKAGVNVVNIANNHAIDFGTSKLNEEINIMKKNGILVSGMGIITTKNIEGIKIGFLGFNDVPFNDIPTIQGAEIDTLVSESVNEKKMITQIKTAKKNNEIVIVSFHWGNEYTDKVTERQIRLGHLAVDAGASLVLGNHPHWVQRTEKYKGVLIVYSHGNLVFTQENYKAIKKDSRKTETGIIGIYQFSGNKMVSSQFRNIRIGADNVPHIE